MVSGVDLVALQLRLARGEDLHEELTAVARRGHAVECRLYAENPAKNFCPSPGTLSVFRTPEAIEGVRIDSGVRQGDAITPYYDPMIAKVIAWGETRDAAIDRVRAALAETRIEGLVTNRDFLVAVMDDEAFRAGRVWTGFVDERRKMLAA
jgi:acetyl/propionyl-CoA carboxylase alpha subunit